MDKWLAELERFLAQLLEEHERMLAVMKQKREALAMAKPLLVSDCCRKENEHLQRIGAIEKRRQILVGQLTAKLTPDAPVPIALRQLAEMADPEQRQRLIELHGRLRATIERVAHEAAVSRKATAGLLRHIQGIMGVLSQSFASLGTYGRKGITGGPVAAVSSFTAVG